MFKLWNAYARRMTLAAMGVHAYIAAEFWKGVSYDLFTAALGEPPTTAWG